MRPIDDDRCRTFRYHSEDGLFCENPNSEYYGWFRNDWKRCDRHERKEEEK